MRVLHFIESIDKAAGNGVLNYLPALLHKLVDDVDTYVIAAESATKIFADSTIHVYSYRNSNWFLTQNLVRFSRIIRDVKPSIAHIHGCASLVSWLFMRQCERCGIPVVITLSKGFEPWHIRHYYWLHRLPKLLMFQCSMILRACAIHALNQQEHDDLLRLTWHPAFKSRTPWNSNIAVVQNFNTAHSVTVESMASSMAQLYMKVADSNPFMLMGDSDKRCEDVLLRIGNMPDGQSVALTDEEMNLLSALNNIAMRRIMLHATDEGIYKYVIIGALRSKVRIPALNPVSVERFRSYYRPHVTDSEENEFDAERIDSNMSLTQVERDVCKQIMLVCRKYRRKTLRRADLATLYRILRYNDYDEVALCHALRRLHVSKRAARLLRLLSERYGLTEGFMPMPSLNDRGTARIRRRLNRFGVQ